MSAALDFFGGALSDVDAAARAYAESVRRAALAVPPLDILLGRRPENLALHALRVNVVPGMSAAQLRSARCALRAVLAAQPGGNGPEEMTPAKADRARNFRVDGEEVYYQIERHPANGWLAVTHQVRAVSLLDGREWIVSERPERPTMALVIELAQRAGKRRPLADITAMGAARAGHHVRVLVRCRQLQADDRAGHVEAVALAWVAECAKYAEIRPWAGTAVHLAGAMDESMAAEVTTKARALWSEVLWTVSR